MLSKKEYVKALRLIAIAEGMPKRTSNLFSDSEMIDLMKVCSCHAHIWRSAVEECKTAQEFFERWKLTIEKKVN